MIRRVSRYLFSTPKQEYSRLFVLRFFFPEDGYYQSNQYRPQFIQQLKDIQKREETILLGGDSFPFGCTTLYFNCDNESTVSQFAKRNVFVEKKLAECEVSEIERISNTKLSNIANFFEMKMDL